MKNSYKIIAVYEKGEIIYSKKINKILFFIVILSSIKFMLY